MIHLKKAFNSYRATMFAISFAVIGLIALTLSFAATSSDTKVLEAESATLSGAVARFFSPDSSGGQHLEFGSSSSGSWEQAVAVAREANGGNGEISPIRDWHINNTGVEHSDCTVPVDELTNMSSQYITTPGTTIENAYITGGIKIAASNVTIRCSVIDVTGRIYAVQATDANASNWTVEKVSFTNTNYESTNNPDVLGNRSIYAGKPGRASYNKLLNGFENSFYFVGASDLVLEYNFTDQIYQKPGAHNTGMNIRTLVFANNPATYNGSIDNIMIYRNLMLDGTSNALSLYTDSQGTHSNITFEENVVDMPYRTSVNYCLYFSTLTKSLPDIPPHAPDVQNQVVRGNIFGQSSSPTCGSSGPYIRASPAAVWENNTYLDGTVIP